MNLAPSTADSPSTDPRLTVTGQTPDGRRATATAVHANHGMAWGFVWLAISQELKTKSWMAVAVSCDGSTNPVPLCYRQGSPRPLADICADIDRLAARGGKAAW